MSIASEGFWAERRWERLAPLAGVVAVVLFVVGFLVFEVVGDTPGSDATAEQYLRYYLDEEGSIWAGAWIFFVGVIFFLWFLGSVRAAYVRAEAGVGRVASIAHTAGVGMTMLFTAAVGTQVSGAIAADENRNLSAETAEALWWAGDGFFIAATFFLSAFFAASAVLALRTRVLPRWLGVVTAILAVAAAIPFVSWAVIIFALPLWTIGVALLLHLRRSPEAETAHS